MMTNESRRMLRILREVTATERGGRQGGRLLILDSRSARVGMIGVVQGGVGR